MPTHIFRYLANPDANFDPRSNRYTGTDIDTDSYRNTRANRNPHFYTWAYSNTRAYRNTRANRNPHFYTWAYRNTRANCDAKTNRDPETNRDANDIAAIGCEYSDAGINRYSPIAHSTHT